MHLSLCFHFHAYQPGDIILRRPTSALHAPEFVERRSPVTLRMGEQDIRGENWTDAMLRFYGAIWRLFREVGAGGKGPGAGGGPPAPAGPARPKEGRAPFCSVDIEPVTLQMLAQKQPSSFWALRELVRGGTVDLVATVPFHVLLPHVEAEDQRFLSRLAFRLHGALSPPAGGALGFWFPECLYSERAGRSVVQAFSDLARTNGASASGESGRVEGAGQAPGSGGAGGEQCRLLFVLDRDQLLGSDLPQAFLSANFLVMDTERVAVFGRDRALSDRWAFRQGTAAELVSEVLAGRTDDQKEQRGVQYALTLASDLESLAASSDQGQRFRELREALGTSGIEMESHSAFLAKKASGLYRRWEGELQDKPFLLRVRESSSWSDYLDQGVSHPSDTRWTGLRRWDGLVIFRWYRDHRISQIWKQGFSKVQERLSRAVRRGVHEVASRCLGGGREWGPERTEAFLLDYSNIVFAPLLLAGGSGREVLDFHGLLARHGPGCRQEEEAALAARAYFEALMANRSCPRFWENIDTRVTFQGTVLMAHALLDLSEAFDRLGLAARAREVERLFSSSLLDFHNAYRFFRLDGLFGYFGWEVSEEAWQMAIQSELPDRSSYDVVKRAALFAAVREGTAPARRILSDYAYDPRQVVADTGHIEGEGHGRWENPAFCENRNV